MIDPDGHSVLTTTDQKVYVCSERNHTGKARKGLIRIKKRKGGRITLSLEQLGQGGGAKLIILVLIEDEISERNHVGMSKSRKKMCAYKQDSGRFENDYHDIKKAEAITSELCHKKKEA